MTTENYVNSVTLVVDIQKDYSLLLICLFVCNVSNTYTTVLYLFHGSAVCVTRYAVTMVISGACTCSAILFVFVRTIIANDG